MTLASLRHHRLVYLAQPYTKQPNRDTACREGCIAAAALMQAGVKVFAPIPHSHTISMLAGIDPVDHPFWMEQDRPMQSACDAVVVLKLPGWESSDGISAEIAQAVIQGQRLYGLDPVTLHLTVWGTG